MVVEVGDHPIRSLGSRPFAVGDVVENLYCPGQFGGEIRYRPPSVAGQFGRGSARNRVEDGALLQLPCNGSQSVADRSRPITLCRILFSHPAVLTGAELVLAEQCELAAAVG